MCREAIPVPWEPPLGRGDVTPAPGASVRTGGVPGEGMEPEERREWHVPAGKPAE